jgi:cytochrome c-type biogenesis protein CcmF
MVVQMGFWLLVLGMVCAALSIGTSIFAGISKKNRWVAWSRNFLLFVPILLTLSIGILIYLLLSGRFEVFFVYSVTHRNLSSWMKVSALWADQVGSLLFWNWLLSLSAFFFLNKFWKKNWVSLPWAVLSFSLVCAFFLGISVFLENPFESVWLLPEGDFRISMFPTSGATLYTAEDGMSLNPLLQHSGMMIHPPMLYLGFAGFLYPFVISIAFLLNKNKKDTPDWQQHLFPTMLAAWGFLSLGLVLGSWWSYGVQGWGGYWGWDPVETAALLPWLSGTAAIHNLVLLKKRRIFLRFALILVILTWLLALFASFLTRSGIVVSVHAFADSPIGIPFGIFLFMLVLASIVLFIKQWSKFRLEWQLDSYYSLESLTLFSNFLLIGCLFVCLWGLLYPLISNQFSGQRIVLDAKYFPRTVGPIFGGVLLLMGFAGLVSWKKGLKGDLKKKLLIPITTFFAAMIFIPVRLGNIRISTWISFGLAVFVFASLLQQSICDIRLFFNKSRKTTGARKLLGSRLIHMGVVIIALGIIGMENLAEEKQAFLFKGEELTIASYAISFLDLDIVEKSNEVLSINSQLALSRNGDPVGYFNPYRDIFLLRNQYISIPAISHSLAGDVYMLMAEYQITPEEGVLLSVKVNPLVNFLWIGSVLLIIGTIYAISGSFQKRRSLSVQGVEND